MHAAQKQMFFLTMLTKAVSTGSFSKNIKTYLSRPKIPGEYLTPSTGTKCKNKSFAHTFRAKIKQGRLQKWGASTDNPKKEHHHGGAVHFAPLPSLLMPLPLPASLPATLVAIATALFVAIPVACPPTLSPSPS